MSTFSGLNTAYTALTAARRGLDVVGQNVANANTPGYTRQRLETSATGPLASMGSTTPRIGQGVTVDGIARLGSLQLDARVRATTAMSGFSAVRANALSALEVSLNEPGANGISASLDDFWASWQGVANKPGDEGASEVLLTQAATVSSRIATGYQSVATQFTDVRSDLSAMADELNAAAAQIANLNGAIRLSLSGGGSANELMDQRSALATTVAALTGATVREAGDGTVDILVGGNAMVTGDIFRPVEVIGGHALEEDPAQLVWSHRKGDPVPLSGGEMAGALSLLATGSDLRKAADSYNQLAEKLATTVNGEHRKGSTTEGKTNLDFFSFDAGPKALNLQIVPKDASGIAASSTGGGTGDLDGSMADTISQLGKAAGSPDKIWSGFVAGTGAAARSELQQAKLAGVAASSAAGMQLANSSVDLDEENMNLLAYQHAYQGAARVMSAIDEMLDTLINRTGIVGR
ncbi:flagellar hook-associated protein FlgK [Arthrobacter sp. zg-ZUI100]|uniref:flagellar hook-associated protein FlgK n=1 Tax=Arthrobacter jiangjiafuii TaxID=2817475 RepID=UPI001AED38AC|nr:flagellar hook-associated protein FlgK [Arthrobacter jiangjiafuii]MBP3037673.1 flagellar hook-associated protein FlgK [Arthrobacter jiangjiafuii]